MSNRRTQPSDADAPLAGMPEPETKPREPNAGELVRAWCRGWSERNEGAQPHPSVVKRVAGVCRNVARDCETLEQWQDAWRAALTAGRCGRYDVIAHLAAPTPQTRGNHYLAIARDTNPASTALAAALDAAEPRALGSAG